MMVGDESRPIVCQPRHSRTPRILVGPFVHKPPCILSPSTATVGMDSLKSSNTASFTVYFYYVGQGVSVRVC